MTLKEYLSQALKLNRAIDSTILRIEEWKSFGLKSRSFLTTGGSNYGKSSGVERTVMKIAQAEERLNRDIDRYVDLHNEIRDLIMTLKNPDQRAVLERHYLLGQTWEKVAEDCFVSLRTVHYQHTKALRIMEPYYLEKIRNSAAG
ncbi:MAG: sigma-70 region 4 domain-containing protein [Oscillospiraceae bacterium]|nr:sigma-70 region 4 domain-containing protein [Oscillospiraceae bacterium]